MKTRPLRLAAMVVTLTVLGGTPQRTVAASLQQDFDLDGYIGDTSALSPPDWASVFDSTGAPMKPLPYGFLGAQFTRDFVPGATGPDLTTFTSGS